MNVIVTSAALGSLYCMIALCIIFVFSIDHFVNMSILGYIALGPYIVASVVGESPGFMPFVLGCISSIIIIFVIAYSLDMLIFVRIRLLSGTHKVIASICLFFITLTIIGILWGKGTVLNSPIDVSAIHIFNTSILWIDIISIISAIIILVATQYFLNKTDIGIRVRALANNPEVGYAYGMNRYIIAISKNAIVAIFTSTTGILLASPGSPRSGLTAVLFFALIGFAPVIVARHHDVRACIVSSFVIAFLQIFSAAQIIYLENGFLWFLNLIHVSSDIKLGPTFADRFIPFIVAVVASIAVPKSIVKESPYD